MSDFGRAVVTYPDQASMAELDLCEGSDRLLGEGGEAKAGGIAFDDRGRLWGIRASDDQLVRVDQQTGVAVEVGHLGFDLRYNAMAWDCTEHRMWGLDQSEGLFVIDLETGAASGFLPVDLSLGLVGMEYDPGSQQFLVTNGPSLYRLDKHGGAVTKVGDFEGLRHANDLACSRSAAERGRAAQKSSR